MSRRLVVEPDAVSDLADAFEWYEAKQQGLGTEFLAEVALVLQQAEDYPAGFAVIRGGTRRALVRRFPYAVSYVLVEEVIVVTAVFHARRDPRRWEERYEKDLP